MIVTNSILSGNHVQSNEPYFHSYNPTSDGGAISGSPYGQENTTVVVNSTISGNNNAIRCASCIVVNNIFDKNDGYDVSVTSVGQIFNNYIDYAKLVGGNNFKRDNIQPGSGSLNFADSNFRIGSGSVAIDAGLSPSSTTFSNLFSMLQIDLQAVLIALATDKAGNNRIAGTAIDLGAYEYGSSAVAVSQPDCLFNWAENTYPQYFSPAHGTSKILGEYYYRQYFGNIYIGISSKDNHLYYLIGGNMGDAGTVAQWYAQAGCQ